MSEMILKLPTVTAPAERLLAALRGCHDELAARVRGLGEADLTRQSYCAEWPVAQVLSHLGSGAEIALAQLEAARTGTTPPGPGHLRAVWARWDARRPRQQAAAFAETVPRLHDAIEALDDAEQRELRPYFHAGPVDLPVVLAFRLAEQSLHAWDVHVAFEPAAAVDAGAVRLLAELLPFGASMADAEVLGALAPARLAVLISDPSRRFVLDLGAQARLCPADDGEVPGSLRLPAEALIRLVTGRLDPAHTPRGPLPRAGRPWMTCGGCTADTDPRRHPATETAGRSLSAEHAPAPEADQVRAMAYMALPVMAARSHRRAAGSRTCVGA